MSEYTSFRCGGAVARFAEPETMEEFAAEVSRLNAGGESFMVLGNGSNVLFTDGGYDGTVLHIGSAFSDIKVEGNRITAGAGALLSTLSKTAAEHCLSGLEFACGIPGSVGGGVFMNAGAYDGELKNVLVSVCAMDANGAVSTYKAAELDLGYRHSAFMENGKIILSAVFELAPGNKDEIAAKMADFNDRRITKQPLSYPSAGSFFKRPSGYFAGKLIEDSGLKGLQIGGAMVSPLHAGFIINAGGATATDVIDLMKVVQETVAHNYGVLLEPEVRIIGK